MNYPMQPVTDAQALMAFQTHKKDTLVAFLLWWFLGSFGGHRFYLNRAGSGVAMLAIALVSIPLMFVLIGFVTWFGIFVWWIVDAFLICGWVNQHNMRLMQAIESQAHASRQALPPAQPLRLPEGRPDWSGDHRPQTHWNAPPDP